MFHGFWIVVLTGPAFLFFFFRLMISLILNFYNGEFDPGSG